MQTKAQQAGHDFSIGPYIERDSKGKMTYFEDSNGYWVKREYDAKGNEINYEDSDGYWEKSEYDAKGNETYWETSDGYWVKREYDGHNWVLGKA